MPSKRKNVTNTIDNQPFQFSYSKPETKELFSGLADEPLILTNGQLYSPINEVFLQLNESNAYSTSFNYDIMAKSVIGVDCGESVTTDDEDGHRTEGEEEESASTPGSRMEDEPEEVVGGFVTLLCDDTNSGKEVERRSFIKFSPLLDPIRYLVGKYDVKDESLKEIPLYNSSNCHMKSRDRDNASYVDSMFSFLSSKMLHHHGFANALDCYGSVIGKKALLTIDVVDDIDYLLENDFFMENNNVLYETSNSFYNEAANHGSRSNKRPLKIHTEEGETVDEGVLDLCDDIEELGDSETVDSTCDTRVITLSDIGDISELESFGDSPDSDVVPSKRTRTQSSSNTKNTKTARTGSTSCSSRTSHTSKSDSGSNESIKDDRETSSEGSNGDSMGSDETAEEDTAIIKIKDFPVNAILLEECEATLDYLCSEDEDFGSEELCAALMQVIMSLIAFHKCFDFQHNDLHTNNVMYIPTKRQYLYYKVNGCHYKVPTYGRIFKIIDFGRATYKFRGNQMCSDSFYKDGDAHSQFNFGRCYNDSRPVIEPNNSFDLCRLGTSLIDFLIDDLEDIEKTKDQTIIMVAEWCTDDRGRNVLWKSNGEERYPGFKLYKMISRTVSKHTPISQLERPILERYKCSRKNIKKSTVIMNIDALPDYTGTAPLQETD